MAIWRNLKALFLSVLFPFSWLLAQDQNILFEHLEAELPSGSIRTILRDSQGYMWFGASGGLVRYDGINYYVYEKGPEKGGLSHNGINIIYEDSKQNIWVGTSMGLNRYDREKDQFMGVTERNKQLLGNTYVKSLQVDDNDKIWIGTLGSGLIIFDHEQDTLVQYLHDPNDDRSIDSNDIISLINDQGNTWVGTRRGLSRYSLEDGRFEKYEVRGDNRNSTELNYVSSLALDEYGTLWVATWEGLFMTQPKDGSYTLRRYTNDNSNDKNLSEQVILSLWSDQKGKLWIGTENIGLNVLDLENNTVATYMNEEGNPQSIKGNSIWTLYMDDEDILWISVYSMGINYVNEKSRKFGLLQRNPLSANSLPDNDIRGLALDQNNKIWIATDNSGICRYDPLKNVVEQTWNSKKGRVRLSDDGVMAILYSSKNELWLGTWNHGVDKLSNDGPKIKNYRVEGSVKTGNNKVISIYEDSGGRIWAGTSGSGLFYLDEEKDQFDQFESDNKDAPSNEAYVTSMMEDHTGRLWVGTMYGLVSLTKSKDGTYKGNVIYSGNGPGMLSSNSIHVIFRDSSNRLWFGTGDNGLNLLKEDGTFRSLGESDGLIGHGIRCIQEDVSGNLWITTSKGLSKFNPETMEFQNFTKEDGLSENFYVHSGLRMPSGKIYFGGKDGLNSFNPDDIKENDFEPTVYLTDLKINGKSAAIGAAKSPLKKHISLTESIELSHDQNSFNIDFVALNLTHPTENQYAYKLDGFDEDWNQVGNKTSATYTNLDPGDYTFMVRGSNNDGVWSQKPAQLDIVINPAIWKTWWAKAFYIISVSFLILLFLKVHTDRIHAKNELKLERMARENEHKLNQLKVDFFTNVSHEIRTPLSLIMAPLESLLASADSKFQNQLSITYRNAQRMMRMINELMDFQKLEELKLDLKVERTDINGYIMSISDSFRDVARNRNIDFQNDIEVGEFYGWIDQGKMETILLNLLANAFKFVKDNGHIKLISRCIITDDPMRRGQSTSEEGYKFLEVSVVDDGVGILPEDLEHIFEKFYQGQSAKKSNGVSGTGVGLAMTKKLIELHYGTIEVESKPTEYTCFTITVPIEKNAYSEEEIITKEKPKTYLSHLTSESAQKIKGEKEIAEASSILVVEDNFELRRYLVGELSRRFKVWGAPDGSKGVEMALKKIPDLIVSDIVMPNKTGIELCRELKNDMKTSHVPIVLLTAKSTIEDKIKGIGTGADAYVPKPFSFQLLLTQIEKLIEIRRNLYSRFSQEVHLMPAKLAENEIDRVFLEEVTEYIVSNIQNTQLNVESLADQFNMSRSQVYRKMKALTGKSAVDFIKTVRLKQSLKLMDTREHTLSEVAFKMGFASPSYFAKSFKEYYGKSPSEYVKV